MGKKHCDTCKQAIDGTMPLGVGMDICCTCGCPKPTYTYNGADVWHCRHCGEPVGEGERCPCRGPGPHEAAAKAWNEAEVAHLDAHAQLVKASGLCTSDEQTAMIGVAMHYHCTASAECRARAASERAKGGDRG